MTLTTGWLSIVPSLMLASPAVSEELKQIDKQTDRIVLCSIDKWKLTVNKLIQQDKLTLTISVLIISLTSRCCLILSRSRRDINK